MVRRGVGTGWESEVYLVKQDGITKGFAASAGFCAVTDVVGVSVGCVMFMGIGVIKGFEVCARVNGLYRFPTGVVTIFCRRFVAALLTDDVCAIGFETGVKSAKDLINDDDDDDVVETFATSRFLSCVAPASNKSESRLFSLYCRRYSG